MRIVGRPQVIFEGVTFVPVEGYAHIVECTWCQVWVDGDAELREHARLHARAS